MIKERWVRDVRRDVEGHHHGPLWAALHLAAPSIAADVAQEFNVSQYATESADDAVLQRVGITDVRPDRSKIFGGRRYWMYWLMAALALVAIYYLTRENRSPKAQSPTGGAPTRPETAPTCVLAFVIEDAYLEDEGLLEGPAPTPLLGSLLTKASRRAVVSRQHYDDAKRTFNLEPDGERTGVSLVVATLARPRSHFPAAGGLPSTLGDRVAALGGEAPTEVHRLRDVHSVDALFA